MQLARQGALSGFRLIDIVSVIGSESVTRDSNVSVALRVQSRGLPNHPIGESPSGVVGPVGASAAPPGDHINPRVNNERPLVMCPARMMTIANTELRATVSATNCATSTRTSRFLLDKTPPRTHLADARHNASAVYTGAAIYARPSARMG